MTLKPAKPAAETSSDLDRDPVEQLAEEFLARRRKGESVLVDQYAQAHPHLAERINDLFPTLLLMEELKPGAFSSHSGGNGATPRDSAARALASWQLAPLETARLGDFRILRELGRGGMGVVYEAEQESLGRHVALKVLPPTRLASPTHLRRFLREAQAAARLHHTNIVPVFGVGDQDGVRYYVMQYIPGQGLDHLLAAMHRSRHTTCAEPDSSRHRAPCSHGRCADSGPAHGVCRLQIGESTYWRTVARMGVQVADALEYAHRQGVLHRDIKPANLLLDNRGTVWIADFGLAKLADVDDLTHSGDTVGTLRYMAPERFSGQADARSDVYSLGLTLYELLTLRPAFDETDRGSLIRQVTQEEPPRPRKTERSIPRDLETIVVKAIASKPEHRYQTAGELAADLQSFLEDRPVRARRITLPGRMWRWCRRNRAVAALSGTALALLLSVAVVASLGYFHTTQALERESEQRELAEAAREQAEAARQQAETERARTKAERERAETNLRLATKAFEDIFSKVAADPVAHASDAAELSDQDEDAEWPEPAWETPVTDKDAAMLESMLKFYDQFAQQNQADVKLQKETARAYRRVGDIHRHLGQYAKSETAYRHALAIYQRIAQAAPENAESLTVIAAIHNELGLVLRSAGRLAEAHGEHRKARETLDREPPQMAALPESRFELAKTYAYLATSPPARTMRGPGTAGGPITPGMRRGGGPRASSDRGKEAAENNRKALEILTKLTAEAPDNARYRLALARTQRDRCWVSAFSGRRDEAEQARSEAIGILEKLVAENPHNADYRYELAETYAMAFPRRREGRASEGKTPEGRTPENAAEQLRRAVELGGNLVTRYPTVPQYKASLARSCTRLAEISRAKNSLPEAEENFTKAVQLHRKLAAEFPAVEAYRFSLMRSLNQLAEVQTARKQWSEARVSLEEAIALTEKAQGPAAGPQPSHIMLGMEYGMLARVLRELGETSLADQAMLKAGEVGRRHGRPAFGPPSRRDHDRPAAKGRE